MRAMLLPSCPIIGSGFYRIGDPSRSDFCPGFFRIFPIFGMVLCFGPFWIGMITPMVSVTNLLAVLGLICGHISLAVFAIPLHP